MTSGFTPRTAAMIGALAFVPVAWYGLTRSGTAGAVSAVNVLLILVSMALLTSSAEGSDHHGGTAA